MFRDGKFKVLVELSQGKNTIQFLGKGNARYEFNLHYKPQTNPYYVRVIWMTDKTGDTKFAVPNDNVSQDYEARLRTAAELMQTFTADRMNELGLGFKTFRLERDNEGKVVVHTLKAQQAAQKYYEMNDQVWWRDVYRWLNTRHPDDKAKNMVLAAFTRKDIATGKMKAHTALGGGNLGLFGSGSVFSWPRSIESASEVFLDSTRFDTKNVHDDSVGRSNLLGLASTTMGATLHEMGHTFGLMHVRDPRGIMSRGFDHFNRAFTFSEPPSGRNKRTIYHTAAKEARFAPISGSMLQWSKWFQLDQKQSKSEKGPRIRYDASRGVYSIESNAGIPWVGFQTGPHDVTAYKEYKTKPLPQKIEITAEEIKRLLGKAPFVRLTTIDAEGGESRFNVSQKQ